MTPEVIEDLYRKWRGFDPPMRDDEVRHRIQRSIAAGTEDDFSVVKNLHVRIKNGRATFYIKFTPKPPNSTITAKSERPTKMTLGPFTEEAVKHAIDQWLAENDDFVAENVETVKKGRARYYVKITLARKPPTTGSESKARAERPIKLTLGEYADRHRDGSGVTYWAALSIVEEWRECREARKRPCFRVLERWRPVALDVAGADGLIQQCFGLEGCNDASAECLAARRVPRAQVDHLESVRFLAVAL